MVWYYVAECDEYIRIFKYLNIFLTLWLYYCLVGLVWFANERIKHPFLFTIQYWRQRGGGGEVQPGNLRWESLLGRQPGGALPLRPLHQDHCQVGWTNPSHCSEFLGNIFWELFICQKKVILLRKTREKYSEVFLLQAGCEQAAHRERPPAFLGSAQPRRRHQVQENDNCKIFSHLSILSFNPEHKGSSMIGWRMASTGKGGFFQLTIKSSTNLRKWRQNKNRCQSQYPTSDVVRHGGSWKRMCVEQTLRARQINHLRWQ